MLSGSVQISLDLLVGMKDTSKKRLARDVLPEFSLSIYIKLSTIDE